MLQYTHKDSRLENTYKYSPFRNIGPQKSYEEMDYNERRQADNRQKLEGQIFKSKQGYEFEIIDYMTVHNVLIRFLCDGFIKLTSMSTIRKGLVWYPFERNQYGGYNGNGYYKQSNSKYINDSWYAMLQRATPEFWSNSKYVKYTGTTICPEWYNFQIFADWYSYNLSLLNPDISKYRYQLDKDILQWGVSPKIYSPYTCCLVPKTLNASLECLDRSRINNLPKGVTYLGPNRYGVRCSYGTAETNGVYLGTFDTPEQAFLVYKKEKETYLKQLADRYLSEGAILKPVRDAIYRIEIKPYGI